MGTEVFRRENRHKVGLECGQLVVLQGTYDLVGTQMPPKTIAAEHAVGHGAIGRVIKEGAAHLVQEFEISRFWSCGKVRILVIKDALRERRRRISSSNPGGVAVRWERPGGRHRDGAAHRHPSVPARDRGAPSK